MTDKSQSPENPNAAEVTKPQEEPTEAQLAEAKAASGKVKPETTQKVSPEKPAEATSKKHTIRGVVMHDGFHFHGRKYAKKAAIALTVEEVKIIRDAEKRQGREQGDLVTTLA